MLPQLSLTLPHLPRSAVFHQGGQQGTTYCPHARAVTRLRIGAMLSLHSPRAEQDSQPRPPPTQPF